MSSTFALRLSLGKEETKMGRGIFRLLCRQFPAEIENHDASK
jgi:hypothetical protein